MEQKKLRESFWVWGHRTNCLYKQYGIQRQSNTSPVEGVKYLGATNLILDVMDEPNDGNRELQLAKEIPNVGWSLLEVSEHPEHVTELIEYSKRYKNITRGVFDDFLCPANVKTIYTDYPPEMLSECRKRLHQAGLEMWMVIYTANIKEIDINILRTYINEFDGISLWFWNEQEVIESYDKYVDIFLDLTKGKKRMIGCYLYDFGSNKEATSDAVLYQLNREKEMLKDGTIEGVILHTNAVVAFEPYEAVETCKAWMKEHGDEEI